MKNRKEYTPDFKAKLIIEALKEEQTMSEIASREGINLKQLYNWRTEFIRNAGRAFSLSKDEKKAAAELEQMKAMEREYQAKVGQLTLEVDFLKGAHKKLFGTGK